MEFANQKSEIPLFIIKDYWTKISTECYLILAVFLVIFLFFVEEVLGHINF